MKIYRFEKNEVARIETIQKNSLWISAPKDFNDLKDSMMESVFLPQLDPQTCNALIKGFELAQKSANIFPFPQEIQNSIIELFLFCYPSNKKKLRDIDSAENKKTALIKEISNYIRQRTGVCCFFSGKPNHPLMWAHYADSHKGFCVEYDVEHSKENSLFEVNYTTKEENPSIEELLLCPHNVIGRLLTRKSHEWSYEKEFRLIYINEMDSGDTGKPKPRPVSIKPNRIITGENFTPLIDAHSIKMLGISITPYEVFINEKHT